jgi:hypothetical protein
VAGQDFFPKQPPRRGLRTGQLGEMTKEGVDTVGGRLWPGQFGDIRPGSGELWSGTEPGIPLPSMAEGIINTDRSHSPDINLGRQISSGRNDANCCLFACSR